MALVVGTNSYINVADAEAYFAERLHVDPWDTADADTKAKALITATRAIDRLLLVGCKADSEQALEFPRAVMTGYGLIADDAVPQVVLDAVCEEALELLDTSGAERRKLQAAGVTSFQLGTLSEVYATGSSGRSAKPSGLFSQAARELMRPYVTRAVGIR